ncbi:MAG TPA: ATP-binding protein [Pyrinomonadaceae bacterium]|jgi:signal transduction histidine kinase|nr:ATP-binding protein [Pyrinomonadaceae bacterium]
MKPVPQKDSDSDSDVVYRRTATSDTPPAVIQPTEPQTSRLAPTLTPIAVGFLLLLVLISGLGLLSTNKMERVSFDAQTKVTQNSSLKSTLLNVRLAVTKLDNEARVASAAESQRIKPPGDLRLHGARDEVRTQLAVLERPPLSEKSEWRQLHDDIQVFLETTDDLRRYSLEGFGQFLKISEELTVIAGLLTQEQDNIFLEVQDLQNRAKRSIQLWSIIALIAGVLVAAGTVWEVQRRFKQMRRSVFEARRERTFTNQLMEGMVSAVAAVDNEDRIRSANAAFFKIFPRATVGASVMEPLGPVDAMKMLEAATATQVDNASYRGRWAVRLDKDEKSFDVYSSPLAIDGHKGQILTLVDATEVAESERFLRRSESLAAVGQATTQVAHEIRNPLGSIRLGVSMLRDSVSDPDALNTIELVERGIKHLNKLVVDVTQFSRQKSLDRSRVDLNDSLDRSIDLVSDRIREKNTTVEKDFSEDALVGSWDADQLRQVFVNVIANAVDASQENAAVRIATERLSLDGHDGHAPKSYARITIADRGKGMDEATRDRIFEPFFSTKKRGTGLGLAIVKQIVEQHGGRISVASEVGKGSKFIIDLPL